MRNCPVELGLASQLPEYARSSHGDLAAQNRAVGPVRGIKSSDSAAIAGAPATRALAEKSGCLACHGVEARVVGPGLQEIAAKYKNDGGAEAMLASRVKGGGQGVWGQVPMPPQSQLAEDDIRTLVKWILGGAG